MFSLSLPSDRKKNSLFPPNRSFDFSLFLFFLFLYRVKLSLRIDQEISSKKIQRYKIWEISVRREDNKGDRGEFSDPSLKIDAVKSAQKLGIFGRWSRRLFLLGRIIFSYDEAGRGNNTLRCDQWGGGEGQEGRIRLCVSAMNFSTARTDEQGI